MTIEDIALQMTPGIGPKGAVHLLEQFGDARSVFAATAGELTGKAELAARSGAADRPPEGLFRG